MTCQTKRAKAKGGVTVWSRESRICISIILRVLASAAWDRRQRGRRASASGLPPDLLCVSSRGSTPLRTSQRAQRQQGRGQRSIHGGEVVVYFIHLKLGNR
jgi:hypothetical protein